MRKSERAMDSEFALQLFEKCGYAVITSINEDGTPYAVPISPVLLNGFIYIHGDRAGLKNDNFARNKNVCLTCVESTKLLPLKFSTEYESAIIDGEIELVENKEEKYSALITICEKYASSNMENAKKYIAAMLEKTAIYKIKIKKASGKANLTQNSL